MPDSVPNRPEVGTSEPNISDPKESLPPHMTGNQGLAEYALELDHRIARLEEAVTKNLRI